MRRRGSLVRVNRCGWAPVSDTLYLAYHDEEWEEHAHDENHLFEMLVLEGAQAGLSWSTILHKREGYRRAFAGFDGGQGRELRPTRDRAAAAGTASIVRNRLKIESAICQRAGDARHSGGARQPRRSLWGFVGGRRG